MTDNPKLAEFIRAARELRNEAASLNDTGDFMALERARETFDRADAALREGEKP